MEYITLTEEEMKKVLAEGKDLDGKYAVDLETAKKILKDELLPLCK